MLNYYTVSLIEERAMRRLVEVDCHVIVDSGSREEADCYVVSKWVLALEGEEDR